MLTYTPKYGIYNNPQDDLLKRSRFLCEKGSTTFTSFAELEKKEFGLFVKIVGETRICGSMRGLIIGAPYGKCQGVFIVVAESPSQKNTLDSKRPCPTYVLKI